MFCSEALLNAEDDHFCWTGIKVVLFVELRVTAGPPTGLEGTDSTLMFPTAQDQPTIWPVHSAQQQLILKCMLRRTGCVIYHALQSLWIDWNKINVVLGLTASIYRVVSAAFL